MSTKYIAVSACDVCDSTDAVAPRVFGYRDKVYTLDLCREDAEALEATIVEMGERLSKFIEAAPEPGSRRRSPRNPDMSHIREWARANGYQMPVRGRLSYEVHAAYAAAMAAENAS